VGLPGERRGQHGAHGREEMFPLVKIKMEESHLLENVSRALLSKNPTWTDFPSCHSSQMKRKAWR